jgi:MoaA/NifB/PqqE/SkfB family radical SAM enzyme
MYRTLFAPINLQIEITERCTHCCRHCYNFFRYGDENCRSMSRDELQILVNEIGKNKVGRIVLTGGEPLVEFENLIWFSKQLAQFPWISMSLNSNLVLLTEEIGKQL